MKPWSLLLLLALFAACKNEPKNAAPDTLKKDEMPAPIRDLFGQLDKKPDSIGLRLNLVDALDSLGAYQQAMGQLDILIKKDSLNYAFWYRKALLQQDAHDTSGALRSYRYAIRIYPAPDAMLGAANLLAEKKDTAALGICKKIASYNMGREYAAHCSFITGIYYARTGDRQKAIESFNATIANDYHYAEAYMEKGFLLYDDKKISDALQVFTTLTTIRNNYADGYYWMAKCYEALNQKPDAVVFYKKALLFDPKLKEAADALARLGVKQEA